MNRDCVAVGGGLYKLKGQSWKSLIERTTNGSAAFIVGDDEDGILELAGEQQNHVKAYAGTTGQNSFTAQTKYGTASNTTFSASRTVRSNRPRGSVMRLDKADMGLYGICPETDPFYAVICDICGSVVKPQGLQKHMTNRHHSLINHTAKLNANGNNSASTTAATTGGTGSKGSSTVLAEQHLSNSYASADKTEGMLRTGTSGELSSAGRTDGKTVSSSYGSQNDESLLLDAISVAPIKVRSSSSGKVKSKNAKNASGASGSSSSSSSSKNNNNGSLSSSFSKTSISTSQGAGESAAEFGREFPAGGAIGSSGVPLVLMSNCSGVLEKKATFAMDRHCGVVTPDGKRNCTRPITCKSHSLSQRRAVPGRSKTLDKLLAEMRGHGMAAGAISSAPKDDAGSSGFMDVMESNSSSSTGFDVNTGDRRSAATAETNIRSSTSSQSTAISTESGKNSHHSSHASGSLKLPPSEGRNERSKHKTSSRSHSSAGGSTGQSSKSSNAHHRQSSIKHGQPRETPPQPAQPITPMSTGMPQQPIGTQHGLSPQQQQQIVMPNTGTDLLGAQFSADDSVATNAVLPDHAAIVMDPSTNLLKLSVAGSLHSSTANDDSSQQYGTTNLMQADGLTVTLPLSVISSMNLAGTNLVNMAHGAPGAGGGADVGAAGQVVSSAIVSTANGSNAMLPPGVIDCGGATEQTAFIPAELIDQIPLVAANGTDLHDPNAAYRLATSTGAATGQTTNGLNDLTLPSYNDQINYTLQTFAQNLAQSADAVQQQQQRQHPGGQSSQVDLGDSIDDIVPTINLLPTATNSLVLPQLQGDLADSIILTPNQLTSLSLVDQHFIDNLSGLKAVSEMDPLTVNGPVDISKLMLLKKVDEEYLKERQLQQQQQQQIFPYSVGQLDEARGVKMWYSSLPKPLHVNNFQLRRLAGGYVMNRKLLNIRRNLLQETGLDGKRLTSPTGTAGSSLLSSNTPHSPLGSGSTRTGAMIGGRTGNDILLASLASPTGAGKAKAIDPVGNMNGAVGGLGSPGSLGGGAAGSTGINRTNSSLHRGQRRLILTPQQGRTEKSSCLLSNAYFKNLISSMQQTKEQHNNATKTADDAAAPTSMATERTMQSLKRSASSLTTLSNKRMKIINNLHNSTAPPSVLLQGGSSGSSGKVKSKVL
uniref:SCA7 domain-containing protein n=1 Tax=Anopheles christyi TaxID=43041 RepID=A0A182JU23_9DIPT